mgnify:CR=1 FL=1
MLSFSDMLYMSCNDTKVIWHLAIRKILDHVHCRTTYFLIRVNIGINPNYHELVSFILLLHLDNNEECKMYAYSFYKKLSFI